MYAQAIARVEPPIVGIHLIWTGPHVWVYSPTGWIVQRRKYEPREDRVTCDELNDTAIAKLRLERERVAPFGLYTLREGWWPQPVAAVAPSAAASAPIACDLFRVDLDTPRRAVHVTVKGRQSYAIALRAGKVVDIAGPRSDAGTLSLRAIAIDAVLVYAIAPGMLKVCVADVVTDEDGDWAHADVIVDKLQMPLGELVPHLDSPDKEFAEGKARLLEDESLDEEEFERLVRALRPGVKRAGPPRPIDQLLLMREDASADHEELIALDPIRVLLSHPKWRRVLGFGWFDADGALEVGQTYEYRVTGFFPAEDLHDTVYGFHTIPSQTLLPATFFLGNLRLRLPEPVAVQRSPDTVADDAVAVTRRGIPLRERETPWWVSIPSLDDHALVLDFPTPVSSIVFELHRDHDLTCTGHASGGNSAGPLQLAPGEERPLVKFPFPVRQVRLRGKGFLHAVRLPSGQEGLKPLSVVLPPVLLKDTPRPPAPLAAFVSNLQREQPAPAPDNTPPAIAPNRPALGFEVTWRPALREGADIWPPDADAAAPLEAALFQIEHRAEAPQPFATALFADGPGGLASMKAARGRGAELLERLARAPIDPRYREVLLRALSAGDADTFQRAAFAAESEWRPVLPEENWTMGHRSGPAAGREIRTHPGADLMEAFPELPRRGDGARLDLSWADVFDFTEGGQPMERPTPDPGTYHRYRVRAVDAVGRPSPTWTETNLLRLEKRIPPPVPVGPDPTAADTLSLPRPSGVQAKVIVRDAPGLTPEDLALLGADANVILLQWGWHAGQRDQDSFAREFRVYATSGPLDGIPGTLTSATPVGLGLHDVTLVLSRDITANAATDAPLDAGYPFVIHSHTAGRTITARIGTRVPGPDGALHQPVPGPVRLHTHLTPDLTRPPAWSERVEVQAIGAGSAYRAVLRNRLTLTAAHARDAIWVGVSAADDQEYVVDQLAPVQTRPGNESAIVPVLCEARYHGRPHFVVPPSLAPVPQLLTPEPGDRAIQFPLDLRPYLAATGLTSADRFRPERVPAAAVFRAYRAATDGRVMATAIDPRNAAETDVEVVVPNPVDRAAIRAALAGGSVDALDDRFVVFLAGSHPYADRLFEPVTPAAVLFGAVPEALPSSAERYVYRVRKSDAAGHLSIGGAMAAVIVRVPSMTRGPSPVLVRREAADAPNLLRLRVLPEASVTHLLTFARALAGPQAPAGDAAIVRIPNQPDAYPAGGLRLRTPEGTLLAPRLTPLTDPPGELDAEGFRHLQVTFEAEPGQRLQAWACTVTRDGVCSTLAGPWGLAAPPAPLPLPALAAARVGPQVMFAWTWPAGDRTGLETLIERSVDGVAWQRVSPLLPASIDDYLHTPATAGPAQYRLIVRNAAGRQAIGDPISLS